MAAVRIVVVATPGLGGELMTLLAVAGADLDVVGKVTDAAAPDAELAALRPDVLLWAGRPEAVAAGAARVLPRMPELPVVGLGGLGREVVVCRMRVDCTPVAVASADDLRALLRRVGEGRA